MEILADRDVDGLILGSACNSVIKTLGIATTMQEVMGSRKKILHANFKAYELENSYSDYLSAFAELDDTFSIYLSPAYTDLKEVNILMHKTETSF